MGGPFGLICIPVLNLTMGARLNSILYLVMLIEDTRILELLEAYLLIRMNRLRYIQLWFVGF